MKPEEPPIAALAEELGIALHEDPGIAEALSRLDLGAPIPRELYGLIAEILTHLKSLR
jgi:flagellar biosynthesis protein